jgi:two-component system, chemotaxis family, CheB/CheR fusion protein
LACREAGHVVERQANHMARLLDDLLDVARITRGRIVLRTEQLDLRETTRSAVEALGPFMAEHETKLIADIDDEPILVYGDAARLQQVQANLLSNASKYSPRGSEVRLEVKRDGDHAVIRVSDVGRGIEPEILPRIFDLFVQGRQSIARPEGGLGIGLTLLKSLVELHNGTVEAVSAGVGLGSVFTVRLPLVTAEIIRSGERHGQSRPPVRTVVLVEDQPDARRMMQLFLEAEGVKVYTAENGVDGIDLIERLRPDLALVDLGLPVMSGFDLARRIREHRRNENTHLVALSGYGQDSDIQAALEAGFDEHLTKPPDHARLQQILGGTDGRAAYLPIQ